jgi:hypothetical protein
MTKDDIIRLAREAGFDSHDMSADFTCNLENIERFAALVAAAEREACAKVCDAECNPTPYEGHITTYQSGGYIMAEYLASAIRARGQG